MHDLLFTFNYKVVLSGIPSKAPRGPGVNSESIIDNTSQWYRTLQSEGGGLQSLGLLTTPEQRYRSLSPPTKAALFQNNWSPQIKFNSTCLQTFIEIECK